MWKKKMKNDKGFMSIEAVMGMATILMVILLGIGFFTYMIPRQAIEEEVHVLGKMAKIQGGLTYDQVEKFQNDMVERGIAEKTEDVIVTLTSEDADGTNEQLLVFDNDSSNNVSRASKPDEIKILKLKVEVPANKAGINGAMSFFGGNDELSNKHIFSERFMSEFYE